MDYTENSSKIKCVEHAQTTIAQILQYTEQARRGLIQCTLPPCPNCDVTPDYFKRHEARQRLFHVIAEKMIRIVAGLLVRWKCPGCGKTFTAYPGFAIPHKRYTLPTIMEYSGAYTMDERLSYRKLLQNKPAGYEGNEKQMEHTNVHRWVATLGGFTEIIRKSQELILQADPGSSLHRDLANFTIAPEKYRSARRKRLLQRCRQLLHIEAVYRFLFEVSIFPDFGTRCAFG